MAASQLHCPRCRTPLHEFPFNRSQSRRCWACLIELEVEVFPAFFRKTGPAQFGETSVVEGESTCFYHPSKKAQLPCQSCGRFLCALCDCEIAGEHLCPACIETGKTKGRMKNLENQRTRYDNIALSLAILPLLLFYFTFITAPIALYVGIRYWRSPRSLVQSSRIRFVVAIAFAVVQIGLWVLGVYALVTGFNG
jgi:uncharacterized paraquat-inducible protein A